MTEGRSPQRVLFLCTANSARSQMAEAILRQMSKGHIEVASAGSDPAADVHPMARAALARLGIDAAGQHPKSWTRFLDQQWDYVVTVCDRAGDRCPVFPGGATRIHWSIEDPAAVGGSPEQQQRAFDQTAIDLMARVSAMIPPTSFTSP